MEKIRDRYHMLGLLGNGATARVFLLWDEVLGRKTALKVGSEKKLLLQEANLLSMHAGPYFPVLYDYWEDELAGALLMEYIEGENLKKRMRRIGYYTENEVLRIACMAAEAVNGLHQGRIPCVYGDIKPENIIMQKNGRIRLVDFGAVCPLTGAEPKRGGTPLYAPPDMWQGKPDIRHDIYSLGRLMETLLEVEKGRKISYDIKRIIERCIQKQKEKRYATMSDFLKEAEAVCMR